MIKHFGDLIGSIFFIVLHEMELIYLSLPTLSQVTTVTSFTAPQSQGWRNCIVGREGSGGVGLS